MPIIKYQMQTLLSLLRDAEHVSTLTAPPSNVVDYVPRNLDPNFEDLRAGTLFLDKNCLVDGRDATAITQRPCRFGDSKLLRIALVGDSEAGAMGPAFEIVAKDLGYSLEVNANSGCEFSLDNPVGRPGCPMWRDDVLENIRKNPPAFIVMIEHGHDGYVPRDSSPAVAYEAGLEHLLSKIDGVAPLIIVQIPMLHNNDIPTCLSTQINSALKCSVPAQPAIATNVHIAEAALAARHPDKVQVIDLTGYFCDQNSCPPIIGNTLVWLDDHHPTAAFAKLLGPVITREISRAFSH